MRSDTVVIFGMRFECPAQMRLARDNDVVHTLTPDRSDQPFGKAILPGWTKLLAALAEEDGTQTTQNATDQLVSDASDHVRPVQEEVVVARCCCRPISRSLKSAQVLASDLPGRQIAKATNR